MIKKLDTLITQAVMVEKINELVDWVNAQDVKPKTPEEEFRDKLIANWMANNPPEMLKDEKNLADYLAYEYGVTFYADVEHKLTSPVYCSQCQMRSQSLNDRMLKLPRQGTKNCEGCQHASAWGGVSPD